MKRIPLITITPTTKVQILYSLASQKALLIPSLYKIFKKSTYISILYQAAQNSNGQNLATDCLYGLIKEIKQGGVFLQHLHITSFENSFANLEVEE
jgi:hypothetical protein